MPVQHYIFVADPAGPWYSSVMGGIIAGDFNRQGLEDSPSIWLVDSNLNDQLFNQP
jgi:hypothetical protein